MLLLIDNYDSFTYNIAHAFEELGQSVMVVRNDSGPVEGCFDHHPDYLVIGPGPGTPESAGISRACVERGLGSLPILGICLGHQVIGELFGGLTVRAKRAMHGMTSPIFHRNQKLFHGLTQGFSATRYHSLILERESFPEELEITAETESGEIMGFQHRSELLFGVQFHPESIATPEGKLLLQNFLNTT
ncbi:MAG: Aminodeoxychorismate synthase component 2 [Chlamydiae bacterium]|nr:Aminodeoxychorismate synthase component 2 [Chlamydiota bacterium]